MTCAVCEQQPRNRYEKPLDCMRPIPEEQGDYMSFHGRSTRESYYKCSECGHKWLYESGNYGMGWQP